MKKIIISLFLLLYPLLFASIAFPAQWEEIDNKTYIDKASITHEEGRTSVWFKALNRTGKPVKYWWLENDYWFEMDLLVFDCGKKQWKISEALMYDVKGNSFDLGAFRSKEFGAVIPGTLGELAFERVCQTEVIK